MAGSSFESRLATLEASVSTLQRERDEYRKLYLDALENCRRLEKGLLGQKSEKLPKNDAQLSMAILGMLVGDESKGAADGSQDENSPDSEPTEPEQKVEGYTRKPSNGRRRIPENLPRIDIEILPPEVQNDGLSAFDRIGEETKEVVEHRPASFVVVRVHRPKFVRKDRRRNDETVVYTGDVPELPIERGLAGPGLLANSVLRRWGDHLPLHRLEKIYAREGFPLARSTICGWHEKLRELVKPLIEAMRADLMKAPYVCVDATGVLVQAPERCKRGHFWVMLAPDRHVLFRYSKKHNSAAVDDLLGDYTGHLVADAHSVYDHIYRDRAVTEVGCWAHARRYFFKSIDSDPRRSKIALAMIGALFQIETEIKEQPRKRRKLARRKRSAPIVDRFFKWCDTEAALVLDDTPIQKAIQYARNQRRALRQFLKDERLPIHNNWSELELRREAVGRKNWLFVGSDDAGETNASMVSLLASCEMHGIEPLGYLRDLFCLLPSWPVQRVLQLAPASWQKTIKQDHADKRLATDPFRRAALGIDWTPHELSEASRA